MKTTALLDSSFLITLVDRTRENHEFAKQYYQQMLRTGTAMHLSTIVISELSVKQDISDFPLTNFRMLPFNVRHGIEAGRLWKFIGRADGDVRHVVKDDVKLIAQASTESIHFILTDDARTFYRHCEQLRISKQIKVRAIKLSDGFDESSLNYDGQRGLGLESTNTSTRADNVENTGVMPVRLLRKSRLSKKLPQLSRPSSNK